MLKWVMEHLTVVDMLYIAMSLVAFGAMGFDKWRSVKKGWRLSEGTLMGLAALGGALGTVAGMIVFRHKIRKPLFYLGAPLVYLLHRAIIMPGLVRLLIER